MQYNSTTAQEPYRWSSAYQAILARKNCPYLIKPQGTKRGSPIGRHHHYSRRCRVDLKSRIGNTTAPKVEGDHPLNPVKKVEGFRPNSSDCCNGKSFLELQNNSDQALSTHATDRLKSTLHRLWSLPGEAAQCCRLGNGVISDWGWPMRPGETAEDSSALFGPGPCPRKAVFSLLQQGLW